MKSRLWFIIFFCISTISLTAKIAKADYIERVGACATPGTAWGVFIQGLYGFVADVGGITSIDISLPSSPNYLHYLNQPRCGGAGIYIRDTLAYLNAFGGPSFTIVNIKNPSLLVRISWVEVPGYTGFYPKGVFVKDSLCYFADGTAGFLIIDISDLLNPTILCTLDTPTAVIDLFVKDTLTYLADYFSLLIVNVSNFFNPTVIGSLNIAGGGIYDVWVSSNYAFITQEDHVSGYGKVHMIDVSDPTTPTFVNQVSMNGTPCGLFGVNDRIYVAANDWWVPSKKKGEGRADVEGGIRVLHWAEPDTINLLLSFDTPGSCRDIFVVDSFMYIAAWDSFMIYKYVSTGIAENEKRSIETNYSFAISPNPFCKQTKVIFEISRDCYASVEVYDLKGIKVKDLARGYFIVGRYVIIWDGKDNNSVNVPSGIYFVGLTNVSEKRSKVIKKMIYIKERSQK